MPDLKKMKAKDLCRAQNTDVAVIDEEKMILGFTCSSEFEVRRYFGGEILSHNEGDVDLDRANDGGSFRDDHWGDQIGVIIKAELRDKKVYVEVQFSPNNERAKVVYEDMRDGIRRNVSILPEYTGKGKLETVDKETGQRSYRFPWRLIHVASVADPADPTVGVGRAADTDVEPDLEESENFSVDDEINSRTKSLTVVLI